VRTFKIVRGNGANIKGRHTVKEMKDQKQGDYIRGEPFTRIRGP